ncbi:DUF7562 family protein [Halobaculum sp. D14]|uniref:DUF7562 family protein n=1 Tax=unclassified Halobaculum TaxID=2640896 RepID=UPI003EBB1682
MLGSRGQDGESVVCIACGESVARDDAREYDKEGDRWERAGKEFEYLCKACHRELCHQPRGDLEALLVDAADAAGDAASQAEFVDAYLDAAAARDGSADDDSDAGDRRRN